MHEFSLNILELLRDSASHYQPQPDARSKPWRVVTALLGGAKSDDMLPSGWQRDFQFAGGLHGISMDLRPNPESKRAAVINDLQSRPPDALLVWVNFITHPDSFINPYLAARPDAYASLLGSNEMPFSYDDQTVELLMHLAEIRRRSQASKPREIEVTSWSEAKDRILALEGDHFALSDRARQMLDNNPYPRVARMLEHVQKLSRVAQEYHDRDGSIGRGLAAYSITQHGIEIALTDKGLSAPVVEIAGIAQSFTAEPHVKVDDAKTSDQCGRIYFGIDQERRRLVVDHIGLHNYG
jgi:hypothetical protein